MTSNNGLSFNKLQRQRWQCYSIELWQLQLSSVDAINLAWPLITDLWRCNRPHMTFINWSHMIFDSWPRMMQLTSGDLYLLSYDNTIDLTWPLTTKLWWCDWPQVTFIYWALTMQLTSQDLCQRTSHDLWYLTSDDAIDLRWPLSTELWRCNWPHMIFDICQRTSHDLW
jgi:hypothetical protein